MKLVRRRRKDQEAEVVERQIDQLADETRENVARLRALDPEFDVLALRVPEVRKAAG